MIDNSLHELAKSLSPELGLAVKAAEAGARVLASYWQRLNDAQIHSKGTGDLVTQADLESEKVVSEFLLKEMPDAAILCEEGTERKGSGPIWYLDPLDGTTNFVQRFPIFGISLALAESDDKVSPKMLAGVVFNPLSGDLFMAAKGRGSYLSERKMSVAQKTSFRDAVIATGFPRRHSSELPSYLREFAAIYPDCRAIRRAGAAALDLCWTAQGIFDAFWEHRLSPWDIAAGILIVEEAGGVCSDFAGERRFLESGNIVGASPAMHAALLEHIQGAP